MEPGSEPDDKKSKTTNESTVSAGSANAVVVVWGPITMLGSTEADLQWILEVLKFTV